MDPKDLVGITAYDDLMTILKERGFSDAETTEVVLKLTAQAEMEVVEEIISRLSEEQLALLDSLPEGTLADEIAQKLGIDGEEVDAIRAEKVAQLISELAPQIDQEDEEVETKTPADDPKINAS